MSINAITADAIDDALTALPPAFRDVNTDRILRALVLAIVALTHSVDSVTADSAATVPGLSLRDATT